MHAASIVQIVFELIRWRVANLEAAVVHDGERERALLLVVRLKPHISSRAEGVSHVAIVRYGEGVDVVVNIYRHKGGVCCHGTEVGTVNPLVPLKSITIAEHGENMVLDVYPTGEDEVTYRAVECLTVPRTHSTSRRLTGGIKLSMRVCGILIQPLTELMRNRSFAVSITFHALDRAFKG